MRVVRHLTLASLAFAAVAVMTADAGVWAAGKPRIFSGELDLNTVSFAATRARRFASSCHCQNAQFEGSSRRDFSRR